MEFSIFCNNRVTTLVVAVSGLHLRYLKV